MKTTLIYWEQFRLNDCEINKPSSWIQVLQCRVHILPATPLFQPCWNALAVTDNMRNKNWIKEQSINLNIYKICGRSSLIRTYKINLTWTLIHISYLNVLSRVPRLQTSVQIKIMYLCSKQLSTKERPSATNCQIDTNTVNWAFSS